MNPKKNKSGLVDLYTFDAHLEQKLIEDFFLDGKFQEHIDKSGMDGRSLYCFYKINDVELNDFLVGKKHEYEIRNSKTGELIKVKILPRKDRFSVN
tara:strand:- start:2084 stop:2371 length:288 start_codon:yes stop_codon:yes gene_type:complete